MGAAVVGDVLAQQASGFVVVLGAGAVVEWVGGPAVPSEECDLVCFFDAGAGCLGEVLGWDPCPGAGFGGAVVGGLEELCGGPGACCAAADAQGVEQGAVVVSEEGFGPQDVCGGVGAYVVGVGPVFGAEEGDQKGPWWLSFGGQEAVEGVGAAGDCECESVGDSVSADPAGACQGVRELGQVGHGRVLSGVEQGRPSAAASLGPGLGVPGSRGRGAVSAVPRLGGRAPGRASSHRPIVSVICDKDWGTR